MDGQVNTAGTTSHRPAKILTIDELRALDIVRPFVAHVHLKGLQHSEFCEWAD
jgi:hypothetical protein